MARLVADANFYLYFPDERAASKPADELRARGFRVESRVGADNSNWLVLARREVAEDGLDELEEEFENLASSHGGEFDGYDRA